MTAIEEWDDDAVLAELGATIRAHTAPPRQLVAATKELFGWRTSGAELAALTFDSLLDSGPAAFRPTVEPPRTLSFVSPSTVVHAALVALNGVRRLIGRVSPPRVTELELTTAADRLTVAVGRDGRFGLDLPPSTTRIALRLWRRDGSSIRMAPLVIR